MPSHGPERPSLRNGFGSTALVLGIGSLAASFTIVPGLVLGVLALIFGVRGHRHVERREADNPSVTTAGIVLGVVGIAASIAVLAFGGTKVATFDDTCREDPSRPGFCATSAP